MMKISIKTLLFRNGSMIHRMYEIPLDAEEFLKEINYILDTAGGLPPASLDLRFSY
jgi:hypothetical protein